MAVLGRGMQIIGLVVVGYGAVRAFWIDFSEGDMFLLLGVGLSVFALGTALLRRSA